MLHAFYYIGKIFHNYKTMKKILLLSAFFILSFNSFSQGVRIGLNFSPAFAFNRIMETTGSNPNSSYSLNTAGKGLGLRFIAGPEIYFFLNKQFAITVGAWYMVKREGFTFTANSNGFTGTDKQVYNLQYVQLPVTMRMFTNEIMTNTRIYFQLGGALDIKLATKDTITSEALRFRPFDASLIIGTGLELKLGESNYLLVGIRYTRGLINTVTGIPTDYTKYSNLTALKSNADLLSIDVGIRF